MRLTCPRCGAQYEIAEDAIPPQGREVECSACENVWFQKPSVPRPDVDAEPTAPDAEARPQPIPASVLTILREEAARERDARAADALSADAAVATAPTVRKTASVVETPSIEALTLPPDVAADTPYAVAEEPIPTRKSGYATGFWLAVLVWAVLVGAYLIAPRLSPDGALGTALADYRNWVDGLHATVSGWVR